MTLWGLGFRMAVEAEVLPLVVRVVGRVVASETPPHVESGRRRRADAIGEVDRVALHGCEVTG